MTQEIKILSIVGVISLIMIVGATLLLGRSGGSTSVPITDDRLLVREDSPKTATQSAKVTLVEFGDYQCPACKLSHPQTKQIVEEYSNKEPGTFNFVFRHFPLPQHKNGVIGSRAAESAGLQGKYWQMHNKLYEDQERWGESDNPMETFNEYAKELGLDINKFQQDINSDQFNTKISRDQNDGRALGVNSTPTYFINGEKLVGVPSYEALKSKIEAALNKNP